jgi:hypothetical protein
MRTLRILASVSFVAVALACAGGKDADEDDDTTATGDDTDTTPPQTLEQTEACEDYVACVSAVDPDGLGAVLDTYGPSGTCWTDGQETADVCDDACAGALDDLRDEHPREEACGGTPSACVGADGTWSFTFEVVDGNCELSETTYPLALTCSDPGTGDFELDMGESVWTCTSDDLDFTFTVDGRELQGEMRGEFAEDGSSAGGSFHFLVGGGDCDLTGAFSAEPD